MWAEKRDCSRDLGLGVRGSLFFWGEAQLIWVSRGWNDRIQTQEQGGWYFNLQASSPSSGASLSLEALVLPKGVK